MPRGFAGWDSAMEPQANVPRGSASEEEPTIADLLDGEVAPFDASVRKRIGDVISRAAWNRQSH
jgi:hypothetical protein